MQHQSFAKLALIGLAAGTMASNEEIEARASVHHCLQVAHNASQGKTPEQTSPKNTPAPASETPDDQQPKDTPPPTLQSLLGHYPTHQCAHRFG